jgi:undecaprenyl-diphosphatase
MIESLVLGFVQGVVEWLPLSSEGTTIAVKNLFFPDNEPIVSLIRLSLFLHLGTFFAALIFFRKDVITVLNTLIKPNSNTFENRQILRFLLIATVVSGFLGFSLLTFLGEFDFLVGGSTYINLVIALMLMITAYLQVRSNGLKIKHSKELKVSDGIILGLAQGFAIIPGLSRSGLTVSALLLREFNEVSALKLSFLMSLPIVLAGNIILNAEIFFDGVTLNMIVALLASFLAGFLTIDLLLKIAKKINFAYFTFGFSLLIILATFI